MNGETLLVGLVAPVWHFMKLSAMSRGTEETRRPMAKKSQNPWLQKTRLGDTVGDGGTLTAAMTVPRRLGDGENML